jgi:hypothetical protein
MTLASSLDFRLNLEVPWVLQVDKNLKEKMFSKKQMLLSPFHNLTTTLSKFME